VHDVFILCLLKRLAKNRYFKAFGLLGPVNTYPITALLPKKRHGKARGVKFSNIK
jgi:hypothetical protein